MSEEFLTGPTSTVRRRRKKKKTKSTTSTATTTNTEVDEAVAIAASSTGGVESVLSKLRDSVSDGDLYTSLQVYKALFARFAKQGDVEPATELAAKGSCLLLRRGLTRAATDLAFQLVDLFTESHTEASETNTVHLLNIVRAYPSHPTAPAVNGTAAKKGASDCDGCDPGKYKDNTAGDKDDDDDCNVCILGQFSNERDVDSCKPCPKGYYTNDQEYQNKVIRNRCEACYCENVQYKNELEFYLY